jgi:hypothetical protein
MIYVIVELRIRSEMAEIAAIDAAKQQGVA